MLMKRLNKLPLRAFSGNDPLLLHLKQQPDPYAKYAHLHWHTCDKREVGRYAELRRTKYADHIIEAPHEHTDWNSLLAVSRRQREAIYAVVRSKQHDLIWRIHSRKDIRDDEGLLIVHKIRNYLVHLSSEDSLKKAIEAAKTARTAEEAGELAYNVLYSTLGHNEEQFNTELDYWMDQIGIGVGPQDDY